MYELVININLPYSTHRFRFIDLHKKVPKNVHILGQKLRKKYFDLKLNSN